MYTAVLKKTGKYYSAWVEEVPGVNTQGKTQVEAMENLREALGLVLDTRRKLLRRELGRARLTRRPLAVPA